MAKNNSIYIKLIINFNKFRQKVYQDFLFTQF